MTPRRGGETSQKVFKTRQDCEGLDWRVAVKENGIIGQAGQSCEGSGYCKAVKNDTATNKSTGQGMNCKADTFKKRPYGPVLKDKQ